MSAGHHLDANVILRFLLADDRSQSPKAKALFELAQAGKLTLFVSHVTLAEVSWVLLSYYDFSSGASWRRRCASWCCTKVSKWTNPT